MQLREDNYRAGALKLIPGWSGRKVLSFVSVLKFPLVAVELRSCALSLPPHTQVAPRKQFFRHSILPLFCELRPRSVPGGPEILLQRGTVKEALGEESCLQGTSSPKERQLHTLTLASSYIPSFLGLLVAGAPFSTALSRAGRLDKERMA